MITKKFDCLYEAVGHAIQCGLPIARVHVEVDEILEWDTYWTSRNRQKAGTEFQKMTFAQNLAKEDLKRRGYDPYRKVIHLELAEA